MQFSELACTFDAIESTSARRELVALLANLFASAEDDELQPRIYLCQGRLVPAFVPLEFGMAEKTVADLVPGTCITIPVGTQFQFHTIGGTNCTC